MAGYVDMKLDYSFKKAFSDREQLRAFLKPEGVGGCVLHGRRRDAFHCRDAICGTEIL